MPRAVVGQRVAVKRAVGRVAVDDDRRVPLVEQLHQRPHLGAFQLDEIAVEVEAGRIGADADAVRRAVLLRPMLGIDLLVAVRVEIRAENDDEVLEQRLRRAEGDVPGEHLQRFLAVDLAGVDVGLGVDDELAGSSSPRPAVLTGGSARMTSGSFRPSPLVPISREPDDAATSSPVPGRKSRTSACREVAW